MWNTIVINNCKSDYIIYSSIIKYNQWYYIVMLLHFLERNTQHSNNSGGLTFRLGWLSPSPPTYTFMDVWLCVRALRISKKLSRGQSIFNYIKRLGNSRTHDQPYTYQSLITHEVITYNIFLNRGALGNCPFPI